MELASRVTSSLRFLERNCSPENGLQNDKIGKNRLDLEEGFLGEEIFTSCLAISFLGDIIDLKSKSNLLDFIAKSDGAICGTYNYFKFENWLPDDVDATALANWVLLQEELIQNDKDLSNICKILINNTSADGIIQVYLPPRKGGRSGRIDEVAACNALRLAYTVGMDGDVLKTEDYLHRFLQDKLFLSGTRYYVSPDAFPLFLALAIQQSDRAMLKFKKHIYETVKERLLSSKFPIDIALRIMTLAVLRMLHEDEVKRSLNIEIKYLLEMQTEEGSFPNDCLWGRGSVNLYFGGRIISTILSLGALHVLMLNGYE